MPKTAGVELDPLGQHHREAAGGAAQSWVMKHEGLTCPIRLMRAVSQPAQLPALESASQISQGSPSLGRDKKPSGRCCVTTKVESNPAPKWVEVGVTMRTSGPVGREMDLGAKSACSSRLSLTCWVTLGSSFCLFVPWFPHLKNDLFVPSEVLGELCAKKSQTRLKCFVCSVVSYSVRVVWFSLISPGLWLFLPGNNVGIWHRREEAWETDLIPLAAQAH